MRTFQVLDLTAAVEDHSGLGWSDPSTGGAVVLRWSISQCELQNAIADLLDYVQHVEVDAGYFGESLDHSLTLEHHIAKISELNIRLQEEGSAASRLMITMQP